MLQVIVDVAVNILHRGEVITGSSVQVVGGHGNGGMSLSGVPWRCKSGNGLKVYSPA
jgi:hypothetical protein